jgi:photosystem II stability/assembly factor-like uncharacterized protein
MVRSADGGRTWQKVINRHFWRMDEDEETHTLYAGNYEKTRPRLQPATLFASTDDGTTWRTVFTDNQLDHIHSVRCDPQYHRVYLSAGDGSFRGQAWSGDNGGTWQWINRGGMQGHTDLAFTDQYVVWGSDDHWGRILLGPRDTVGDGKTVLKGRGQDIWFVVAEGSQAYAGTRCLPEARESSAFLLASSDGGRTWRKLLRHSAPAGDEACMASESRRLSTEGWLFFTTTDGKAYRVRRTPGASPENHFVR